MHPMVLRKPLGGFAIRTPSFYQNHWVPFAKALGGFPKTIGWESYAFGGLLRRALLTQCALFEHKKFLCCVVPEKHDARDNNFNNNIILFKDTHSQPHADFCPSKS